MQESGRQSLKLENLCEKQKDDTQELLNYIGEGESTHLTKFNAQNRL